MAKIKPIKSIGGFKVKDLLAPNVKDAYVNSKGNLISKSTGQVFATHKEILKEKQRYQRLVKKDNFELGGERYNSLNSKEKKQLKKWGFSKRELKKLSFTNRYSEKMRAEGGNRSKSGALKFSDILYKKKVVTKQKIDKKTGEIKEVKQVKQEFRNVRRSKDQNLYSGKTAVEKRKEFVSGKTYRDKRELYESNYRKALESGNLKVSKDINNALMYALDHVSNIENIMPELDETYLGYQLKPQDTTDKEGNLVKGIESDLKDMIFYKAYNDVKNILDPNLRERLYAERIIAYKMDEREDNSKV